MNISCSDLFTTNQNDEGSTSYTVFKHDEQGLLDLTCLGALRLDLAGTGVLEEKFLPKKIWIRPWMNKALEHRQTFPDDSTVIFGSPGVGKSAFAFLDAIRFASTGYDAVLYVRKVTDKKEPNSAYWMTPGPQKGTATVIASQVMVGLDSASFVSDISVGVLAKHVNAPPDVINSYHPASF